MIPGLQELLRYFRVPDCLFGRDHDMVEPSQSALRVQRVHTRRLAQDRASVLDTLSCHDMPSIRRMLLTNLRRSAELLSVISCLVL